MGYRTKQHDLRNVLPGLQDKEELSKTGIQYCTKIAYINI